MGKEAAPGVKRLFDSLEIQFNLPFELKFDLFDFSLAQRWAALLDSHLQGATGNFRLTVNQPNAVTQSEALEKFLFTLGDDNGRVTALFKSLEVINGAISPHSLELLEELFRERYGDGSAPLDEAAGLEKKMFRHHLDSAAKSSRHQRRTGMKVEVASRCSQHVSLPLENADFEHFRETRLPGGIRIQYRESGKSALDCAEQGELRFPPVPMRNFGPSFRLDLAEAYADADSCSRFSMLRSWAESVSFPVENKREWSDLIYVGQLSDESRENAGNFVRALSHAHDVSIIAMRLKRSPGTTWKKTRLFG